MNITEEEYLDVVKGRAIEMDILFRKTEEINKALKKSEELCESYKEDIVLLKQENSNLRSELQMCDNNIVELRIKLSELQRDDVKGK